MPKSSQFKSGNYNSWDTLVKETLPGINDTIRHGLLEKLDATLESMLGGNNVEYTKESIDIAQVFENNTISGITCDIKYTVDDFQVPDAPQDAIKEDCEAIKNAIADNHYKITNLSIDTSNGELSLSIEVDFEEYTSNDQTGISAESNAN